MPYFAVERDPQKRKVKPPQALFELDDDLESSDDSDFRIEDHDDESDDDSIDSNANGKNADGAEASESDSEDLSDLDDAAALEATNKDAEDYINNLSDNVNKKKFNPKDALKIMICTVCLGDRSDPANEIIECDNCGVTVHEGCYGVQDSDSVCSTDSPCPTTPWFCDACKAGLKNAQCELCPNFGGIFKETDVGKWVHLVCALYMPGVAFGEVDKLQNVTLFEMSYTKWGQKACSLCRDQRFARTGVCVGCDAGMCKTYFHVTCGQREGLLAEAHSEEVEQADPFYAHCKLHTDKTLLKARKRNWLALQMRMEEIRKNKKEEAELQRIQRRLAKYRKKYMASRSNRLQPWVPTQKMPRLLTTSASACRALWRKAELSGADTQSLALRETQVEALAEIHKRWNIPPAFSVEFIAYYLDRNSRITSLRKQVIELSDENSRLLDEQAVTEEKKDKVYNENLEVTAAGEKIRANIMKYYDLVTFLCPKKQLPVLSMIGRPMLAPPVNTGKAPLTVAAKKGFPQPVQRKDSTASLTAIPADGTCCVCKKNSDQHLLTECDKCKNFYHLNCLDPPLAKMPKKTKIMGWQCSECDEDTSSSDSENVDTSAPRQLRKSGADNFPYLPYNIKIQNETPPTDGLKPNGQPELLSDDKTKERKRKKHSMERYSPEPVSTKSHKHKHKRSKQQEEQRQSLKIRFKSVPSTGGGSSYVATPSAGLSADAVNLVSPTGAGGGPAQAQRNTMKKREDAPVNCSTCKQLGDSSNLVTCDECLQGFHFQCLDPPVKKSPKVRGYSWHCANCDPTESDE
ncbi:Phd finger protein [Nesidiocoris tenuis]|uniref:Phd finger protein n=1 Tax=Nesidiocoris tenuis TaxID=355587 RepID=A0ABN7B1X8_9HEMI|nr:Phd finger protein [Nesidiocoris tenuis]